MICICARLGTISPTWLKVLDLVVLGTGTSLALSDRTLEVVFVSGQLDARLEAGTFLPPWLEPM